MGKNGHSESQEHRIDLSEEWSVWRCAGLRGAGFPATNVLRLCAPEAARAADRVLLTQKRAEELRIAALERVNHELDSLRKANQWDDKENRRPLLDAMRQLKTARPAKPVQLDRIDEPLRAYQNGNRAVAESLDEYCEIYAVSVEQVSEAIREIAGESRFREAVTWQNRHAVHSAIDLLLRQPFPAKRGSKQRQYEELVASYLQRYCVKNDTIGFFGPVGWAHIDSGLEALRYKQGPNFLATRRVYFEGWCIDELARTLEQNEQLEPWMTPIRLPNIRVEGTTRYGPLGSKPISKEEAFLLQACDGNRPAKEVVQEFRSRTNAGESAEPRAYQILRELKKQGLIAWGFNIPLTPFPEQTLRSQLVRIEREDLRSEALSALGRLEDARSAVAAAAGDPQKLDRALGEIDRSFECLTGTGSTRAAGEMYAGRTLVYEDCCRDLRVDIGPQLLGKLANPLRLLLTSARWFTSEVAKIYRKKLVELHTQLARKTGSATVDFTRLLPVLQPHLLDTELVRGVQVDFQERWGRILSPDLEKNRVIYDSDRLEAKVLSEFRADAPGWPSAHYHSPDVMIAASGADAVARDDYEFVLGEFHLASNTLAASLFTAQHPSPESLTRALESDITQARVIPVAPKGWWRITSRTNYTLVSAHDLRLEFGWDAFAPDRANALPAAELVVEEDASGLAARTRDGRLNFDPLDLIGLPLSLMIVDLFRILGPARHTPRVAIDRLVVNRETWRFEPDELLFACEKSDAERFLSARRWAASHGMPRFVFVKTPVEVKPCYVDFNSTVYVDLFSKLVRRVKEHQPRRSGDAGKENGMISVSEMLPAFDRMWLHDTEGRPYAAEFRFVVFDRAGQASRRTGQ